MAVVDDHDDAKAMRPQPPDSPPPGVPREATPGGSRSSEVSTNR